MVDVEKIREHVEKHKDRERAMFTVAGVRALLDELDRREDAIHKAWQSYEILEDRLREVERRAKGDILAVYDECERVAVPAHPSPYRQVELYRLAIRQLKARALSTQVEERE